jgi:DNA polymerase/3'-5' exonuclease PolX
VDTPNAEFIEQLKEVRKLRLLQGDQIGVRAYSTSIAALAAYPHAVQSSFGKAPPPPAYTYTSVTNNHPEVSRLPGCGTKIAQVWQQWKETGHLNEVVEGHKDAKLSVLKQFYDIWGVGDTTARDLYAKGTY